MLLIATSRARTRARNLATKARGVDRWTLRVALALVIVYVVWGSTYLAIDVAIQAVPPMLMMAVRFALAGTLLYVWAARNGATHVRPTLRQWGHATLTGGLLLVGGTGLVALSLTGITSGTAALLASTVPVWMALLGRVVFGDRLSLRATGGLVLGLAGVALLVDPSGGELLAMLLAVAGAFAWAAGSMRSRVVDAPTRPMLAASMEMIGASVLFALVGLVRGELAMVDVAAIGGGTLVAFFYLVTAGSLLAFSVYRWLLLHASTTLVGTHAYVNPVVAVLLGWVVLGERLTARMIVAGAVVVVATALVVTGRPGVPVPAQPTSGGDAFAGERRLRRLRDTSGRIGRAVGRAPAAALRGGLAPMARGYRAVRRGPAGRYVAARRTRRARPEDTV